MIQCKIISVNPSLDSFKSTQEFGQQTDNNGIKQRYIKRRQKMENFVKAQTSDKVNITLFDAVTPNDFTLDEHAVHFNERTFVRSEQSSFYISNTLSHYQIWNIHEDTLIFEDDIILTNELIKSTICLIHEFKHLNRKNSILYLQRSVPWLMNVEKDIFLDTQISDELCISTNTDFSGTAAYYITKETKQFLLSNIKPIVACDKYLADMMRAGLLEYCIPTNKSKMFFLDQETMWM